MICEHLDVAKWDRRLLLFRWAGFPPPMWKRRTDATPAPVQSWSPPAAGVLPGRSLHPLRQSFPNKRKKKETVTGGKAVNPPPTSPPLKNWKKNLLWSCSHAEQTSNHMFPEHPAISHLSTAPATPQEPSGSATSLPPLVSVPSFPLTLRYVPRRQTYVDTNAAKKLFLGIKTKERSTEVLFSPQTAVETFAYFSNFQPLNWCAWYLNVTAENGLEWFERCDPCRQNRALFACMRVETVAVLVPETVLMTAASTGGLKILTSTLLKPWTSTLLYPFRVPAIKCNRFGKYSFLFSMH